MFIHFTSAENAASIVSSMVLLLSRTIVDAVYAAPVGGANVPGVQHARVGQAVAVLFVPAEAPDTIFPEEAIWHRTSPLSLSEAIIVDAAEARELLDGSAGIPDDGIFA